MDWDDVFFYLGLFMGCAGAMLVVAYIAACIFGETTCAWN